MKQDETIQRSLRLSNAIALIAIIVGGILLRFHALGAKTFWFDEGVSVGIARLDAYNFLRILWRREANMSLYYLLLHAWLWVGNNWMGHNEAFIRSLSALFGTVTIPALYLLGRRLFDSRTALIVAALLAVNAFHVCYSQEARSYSLMALLCVLSSLYFFNTLGVPSPRNRALFIFFSVLAVYAHFYSLLLVVAQWLYLRFLKCEPPAETAHWNRTWKTIAVSISPILLFVVTTGAGPLRWIPRPGMKDLWTFAILFAGHSGVVLLIAILPFVVLGAYPAFRPVQNNSTDHFSRQFLLMWLLFPILLVLALSIFRPLFLPRYFLFCLPALLLLAAAGLARIRPSWLLIPALLLCVALSLRGTLTYYDQDFDNERDDWRSASNYLLQHAQPGDALLFHVPMGRMPYEYYHSLGTNPDSVPIVLYPSHGERITFLDFVEKPNYAQISDSLSQHPRVWVVIAHAETPSGLDRVATALTALAASAYPRREQTVFNGIDVFLYH